MNMYADTNHTKYVALMCYIHFKALVLPTVSLPHNHVFRHT